MNYRKGSAPTQAFHQSDIFAVNSPKKTGKVVQTLDNINRKYGKSTIHLAAEGFGKEWLARSNKKSPNYTTQWSELAKAAAY